MNKECPKCHIKYSDIENYCTKCGIELIKVPNHCSANKTTMCSHRQYADDDIYCAFCGSLTTYAIDKYGDKT